MKNTWWDDPWQVSSAGYGNIEVLIVSAFQFSVVNAVGKVLWMANLHKDVTYKGCGKTMAAGHVWEFQTHVCYAERPIVSMR